MVDVVTESAREGALSELLYACDLVMRETIEGNRDKYLKWKESKNLKVNRGKTKEMFSSSSITQDGLTHVKSAAWEQRLTQYCMYNVVSGCN